MSAASALTVLRQIVVTFANCLLAIGLGLPVDPLVFGAAFLAALLIARLPGSLGGSACSRSRWRRCSRATA